MKPKFILLLAALLLTSIQVYADYDFVRGGIYYLVTSAENKTVEVAPSDDMSYSGDITIPSTVTYMGQTYTVTSIGNEAFNFCDGLTHIIIPNSVRSIGNAAFNYCSGLTSVTIPENVTSIGYQAFQGCCGLTSIKVASGNSRYDSRNNCNAIIETATNTLIAGCQNTIIPNGVTSIEYSAFSSCTGLTSITIPNSVTSISDWAFGDCSSLISITIPNSVTNIGDYAFQSCI